MIGTVMGGAKEWREQFVPRLLRGDTANDLLRIIAVVVAYAIVDVLTRATASVPFGTGPSGVLAWRSLVANPLGIAALAGVLVLVWRLGRGNLFDGWSSIQHGRTLRWLALPMVLVTMWELSFYEYNYLLDQWHVVDRLLVVALAVGVWFRPIVLVPFVLQARIVAEQFVAPFGTTAGKNIGELLLVALLVIVAMHVVVALTDDDESAAVVLVLGAAIATHFFLPGVAKAQLGWVGANEPGNFALNSYTAGWLGGGGGGWARTLADAADNFAWVIVIVTVVVEFCAFVAVYHRKLLRCWLPLWAAFQFGIFAMSGFFLVGWIVLELALFALLLWSGSNDWLSRNDTPARGLIAVGLVVLAGPVLFHPPRLAWIDSPIAYGYEVEVVGVSGAEYHVPLTAFAPFQQELSLGFAQFRDAQDVVGGYGAADSVWRADALAEISTFEELAAFEAEFAANSVDLRSRSETLVTSWFDAVNEHGDPAWFPLSPVTRYWSSRPGPTFEFEEPLASMTVAQVASIHGSEPPSTQRTVLLVVEPDRSGDAFVTARSDG